MIQSYPKKKILIIDDHEIFRAGLRMIFSHGLDPEPEIVDLPTIEDALNFIRNGFTPDLIITDLLLPGISGLDGLQLIKKASPNSIVVLMTALVDRQIEHEAIRRKANAFMDKTMKPADLISNIKRWLYGENFEQPSISYTNLSSNKKLTDRQIEVLNYLVHGKSNKVIARILNVSENTIRVHVSAILDQLGCSSRQEAAELAKRHGLISSI